MLSSNTLLTLAAGAGVVVFFCAYYDRKRRSDPMYKQKLRERRKKALESAKKNSKKINNKPSLTDPESCQRFFLQEVQLGEELLSTGDIPNGVEHLANALAVCSQPQQLMSIFQQSLPPQVCQLLVAQIPIAAQRIMEFGDSDEAHPFPVRQSGLVEEDLE